MTRVDVKGLLEDPDTRQKLVAGVVRFLRELENAERSGVVREPEFSDEEVSDG